MATTPAAPTAEQYGIAETATGITIESLTETPSPIGEPIPDQKNATVKEVYVDSHESAGSYNGLKRYNLRAHRFDNAPAAAST